MKQGLAFSMGPEVYIYLFAAVLSAAPETLVFHWYIRALWNKVSVSALCGSDLALLHSLWADLSTPLQVWNHVGIEA